MELHGRCVLFQDCGSRNKRRESNSSVRSLRFAVCAKSLGAWEPQRLGGNSSIAYALGYPFYSTPFYHCLGAFLKCSRPRAPFLTQMLTLFEGQVKSAQPCFEFEKR